MGGQSRSEVLRYDGRSFVPYIDGASVTDLAFSADGQRVAYISVPEGALWTSKIDGRERIELSDPSVMEAALPRWSPDGRYIAAITTDSQALMVFDRTHQHWTVLARMGIGFPSWSHDGQYLYFDSILTEDPAFFRVRISDRRLERLVSLKDIHRLWGPNGEWSGLGPDDSLLVTRDIGSPEIYALDWQP